MKSKFQCYHPRFLHILCYLSSSLSPQKSNSHWPQVASTGILQSYHTEWLFSGRGIVRVMLGVTFGALCILSFYKACFSLMNSRSLRWVFPNVQICTGLWSILGGLIVTINGSTFQMPNRMFGFLLRLRQHGWNSYEQLYFLVLSYLLATGHCTLLFNLGMQNLSRYIHV